MMYWRLLGLCFIILSEPSFAQSYASNPNLSVQLDATDPGISSAHHLSFSAQAGELETYRAQVRYPTAFAFLGFDAIGPINSVVGSYQIDLNSDNQADVSADLRSLTDNSAYLDLIADGNYSAGVEPVLDYSASYFLLTLPYGGDGNPMTSLIPWSSRVTLSLFAGILVNPTAFGSYTINASFLSVDPDTGDADDNAGSPSQLLNQQLNVTIMLSEEVFDDGFEN